MRRIFLCQLLLALTLCTSARSFIKDSLLIDGRVRHFLLYMPQGIQKDAPLVFCLHGYGGSPEKVDDVIAQGADRHGFALCLPVGLKDPTGQPSWNVGYPMQKGWEVDDEECVCRMARYVQKKYHLSRRNTFFSGMSNGGEMCYLLAYSGQKVFKAIGSIAGLTMQWIYENRQVQHPVPFLEIHGTDDQISLWEGDPENRGGWNPYMPVPVAVDALVKANQCTRELTDTITYPSRPLHRPIIRHKHLDGTGGTEVWLYEVIGAQHCYFIEDMHTGDVLWEFFSKYVE